ncbi:alpha/beta hydrolase [Maribacter cobaltidurans]|uniref:Alpha/beta hydrolase n=1 Tax=Maribacter cobaltidurans TaxID=1178778 RepID=A0A223V9A7_9FLAO|nr:alpha/beta hydrolase [Maribacter cobaltidurans]ASV31892.1 alpha/beta hydrolase [Maribacter cobaltidurans]GGD85437.1 alpha/beta hydrolase [Maribacter cobaltidurans]
MQDSRIHIYFMPGMAASSSIFEFIKLPEDEFCVHFLDWFIPKGGQSLQSYAKEMSQRITHENPVLLGVSLGGILVQEIAKYMPVKKVIIVSSVKLKKELPKKMLFARYTKIHKLLPTGLVNNVELLAKYAFGETVVKRLELYEKYLSIRDKRYIDWCIDQMVNWRQTEYPKGLIHIHGDKDAVFPIANISDCKIVKNGTHTMIIHRAKWFNEHLPTIILD